MEENKSPRKTRSGKLLGDAIPGGEVEDQEEAGVEVIREETVVDVIDLTEDYFDVDELVRDDDDDDGNLGDVTEATRNEDLGNGTITIVDDLASIDDIPTGDNELNEDRIQGGVLHRTIDLTDSPLIRSNLTVSNIPNVSATFISASTSGASITSTSASSTSGDSLPSTAASNASAAVTCRICMDSQLDLEKEGHNLLSTVCGHIFCSKCLPNYIKKRGLCPICRKVLKPKDFHQIFL